MGVIKPLLMSLGMFSAIPVPKNSWNDKYMYLVIVYFPVVGAIIGGIWYAIACLLIHSGVPFLLQTAVIMLTPWVLSGFLHIDGYMDTADAVFSRRDLAEKRRILKDSHIGAFAVIALLSLFLLQFCAIYSIVSARFSMQLLILIPIVSRCFSGLALLNLRPIAEKGYMAAFKANTRKTHSFILGFIVLISFGSACFCGNLKAVACLLAALVASVITTIYTYKQLQGLSGDLCGCILTVSELCGLLCMALLCGGEGI